LAQTLEESHPLGDEYKNKTKRRKT